TTGQVSRQAEMFLQRDVYTAGGCVREQSPHLQGIMHFYHAGETFKLYLEMGPSEFVSRICEQNLNGRIQKRRVCISKMHTLNFMWHGFRFPRCVFWGFKPFTLLESKGFGAKSPLCCMAYAIFTYLGVKGTGINRL
uniref:Uncharacterized protein n=1 Tax=Anser brachyrhynchus TaxID=132585 RepID=A0A8B9B9E5_9AVES